MYAWEFYQQGLGIDPIATTKPSTQGYVNTTGWVQCSTPVLSTCVPPRDLTPIKYLGSQTQTSCNSLGDCTSVNESGGEAPSLPVPDTPLLKRLYFLSNQFNQGGPRRYIVSQWIRDTATENMGYADQPPKFWPVEDPATDPPYTLPPSIDPMEQPISKPAPEAAPIPYRVAPYRRAHPGRSPIEQTWRGPIPVYDPYSDPFFNPFPDGTEVPGVAPSVRGQPGPTIVISPEGNLDVRPPARPANPRPPGPRVVERKFSLSVNGTVGKIVNAITEGKDFVEVLWFCLPKAARSKAPRGRRTVPLQTKMQDIYNNFWSLDGACAMQGFIREQAEDRFYGRIGRESQRAARANPYYVGAGGFQLGGRYRPRADPQWIQQQIVGG